MDSRQRRSQGERRAETERRVLDAATALIAENGSRSVSLAEVGRRAGYSRGIVSYQFGSKNQLLAAVVARAQHFDLPVTEARGLDQLTVIIHTYLSNVRDRAPLSQAFLQLWAEAVASDPFLAPLFAERDAWFRNLLADQIRTGMNGGSIRTDVVPEAVAMSMLGLLRGIAMQLMSTAKDAELELITEQVTTMITRGLTAD